MAEIYSKSYLTIAASRASNSHHGFLFDFPDDTIHYNVMLERPWDVGSQPEAFQASFRINHESSESGSTPLNKRAWCLQEWYLPVRMVEFHLHDLKFRCEERGLSRFGAIKDKGTWSRIALRGSGPSRDKELENLWEAIRDDYFGRNLSKKSDLLPAMAGLAKRFQSLRKHSTYLAGIWSHNLAEDLSWTALNTEDEITANDSVPSWSWASITDGIGYLYYKPITAYVELIDYHCTGFACPKEVPASIQLQCFLTPVTMRVDPCLTDGDGRPTITLWTDKDLAAKATIEQVKAVDRSLNQERTGSFVVLDMNIGPTSHKHNDLEASQEEACRVPSIARVPKFEEVCNVCSEKGYVAPIQLMFLTKSQVAWTALVLAPVPAEELKTGDLRHHNSVVYRRLALLEIDCVKGPPIIRTAEGNVVPAEYFWDLDNAYATEEVTLI
jgi:heterokaryon incompatibility protein (HET)